MKRVLSAILIVVMLATLLAAFCGCEIDRKLNGAEFTFAKTIKNAEKFSFDMTVTSDDQTKILLSCYKMNNDYSYVFRLDGRSQPKYRQMFVDGKKYSIIEILDQFDYGFGTIPLGTGTYYVEQKSYTSSDNILYSVTQNILGASYATLIKKAKKDKNAKGETLYKYEFNYDNTDYTLWFDDYYLRQAKMVYSDDSSFFAEFDNFVFGTVDAKHFQKPEQTVGLYVESPFAFEDWANIILDFGNKIIGRLPQ